mgnify:CR=1 FL=1
MQLDCSEKYKTSGMLGQNAIVNKYNMFYKLAHILRDRFPWLWEMMEWLNGWFFASLYGHRLRHVVGGQIARI